jgi:hypothetical protein
MRSIILRRGGKGKREKGLLLINALVSFWVINSHAIFG